MGEWQSRVSDQVSCLSLNPTLLTTGPKWIGYSPCLQVAAGAVSSFIKNLQPKGDPFPVSPGEKTESWRRCEFCQNEGHTVLVSARGLEPCGSSFLSTWLPLPPAWLLDFCLCVLVSESGTDPSGLPPSIPHPSLFMSTLMGLCRLAQLPSASQRATWSCVCHRMFTVCGAETKQHPSC